MSSACVCVCVFARVRKTRGMIVTFYNLMGEREHADRTFRLLFIFFFNYN